MARHLHAVDAETPEPPAAPPESLAEAADCDRRTFLAMARRKLAEQIDAGVPAHSLARLIGELSGIDAEIRRIDEASGRAAKSGEVAREQQSPRGERRPFDPSAL